MGQGAPWYGIRRWLVCGRRWKVGVRWVEAIGELQALTSLARRQALNEWIGSPGRAGSCRGAPSRVFHDPRERQLGLCRLGRECGSVERDLCQWHGEVFVRLKDGGAIGMGPRWSKDGRGSGHPG